MGLRVRGKLAPETVKPLPVTVAALTVTAVLPVEVKVTDCVAGVFTLTLPKDKLPVPTLSVGTDAPSCRAEVLATSPALAVKVTVCAVLTEETVAAKLALVAPTAMVTEAGTTTALLLLARLTVKPPPAAAAFSVTVQLSVPAPVMEPLLQLNALRVVFEDLPRCVPKRLTSGPKVDEVLFVVVSEPVVDPIGVEPNCVSRRAAPLSDRAGSGWLS